MGHPSIPAETELMGSSPDRAKKPSAAGQGCLGHKYCKYIILAVLVLGLLLLIVIVSLLVAYVWFDDSKKGYHSGFYRSGILLLGGDGSAPVPDTEFYDLAISTLPLNLSRPFLTPRLYLAAVFYRDCVYIIGGSSKKSKTVLNSTELLCGLHQDWKQGPSLNIPRKGAAASVVGDRIYVCGGDNGSADTRLASCEYLDKDLNMWIMATSMLGNRDDAPGVALNGTFYVIGGYNKSHNQLNSVQVYHPATDSWSETAHLRQRREHHAAAALGRYIYTCGGYLADRPYGFLRSCERCDPESNSWSFITPLLRERDDFAMVAFQGKLYVLGGENVEPERTVEVYDPVTGRWSIGQDLAVPRRFHAAVSF